MDAPTRHAFPRDAPAPPNGTTRRRLNKPGDEYRVKFSSELLFMNPGEWGEAVAQTKIDALGHLRERGYRVVAAVDNEPENLEAMADADRTNETLFLHASTIYLSARRPTSRLCSGSVYDLTPFVVEAEVQGHVQLVLSEVTRTAGNRPRA